MVEFITEQEIYQQTKNRKLGSSINIWNQNNKMLWNEAPLMKCRSSNALLENSGYDSDQKKQSLSFLHIDSGYIQ